MAGNFSRPRNESAKDLEREERVRRLIEQYRGKRVTKLSPVNYQVDWAVADPDGTLTCYGEYKFRSKKFDTLLISAAKCAHGAFLAHAAGVPFRLFIEWPHGVYWADLPASYPIKMGGNSRGQDGDWEPMAVIDTAIFRELTAKSR